MTVSLVKGQKIDLTKGNAGLSKVVVGLGWDPAVVEKKGFFGTKKTAVEIDIDASVILLDEKGHITKEKHVVYFGNLQSPDGSVVHSGDNRTGDGDGDDEQVTIQLGQVPADVSKMVFVVNIYDCVNRKQDFGLVQSAYIRVLNGSNQQELVKFNLTDNYASKTSLIVGEIYRHSGEWKFNAIGEGTTDTTLGLLVKRYQ
ncbi:TerD family protein [Paenibacillus roseipurpureus]|uniref:TerD family protein n=1 Tax=Paenibacillus roseopurpureus TaxID=2918901 RepID=A0AA96RLD5_9BACL|nr:TerD family protein [Paenibacillus sp. MBLB1832]WNR45560.1 TerD family protein [Paenibacillus sp. MBLB1832]